MKVIFQGQLWSVAEMEWDGLALVSMDEPEVRTFAQFGSEDLNVDPTDAEVEAVFGVVRDDAD